MRYLRMLSNSLIGGAMGAAYLTVLVLQLNPQVPLEFARVTSLALTLALSYGVHLAMAFYALIVIRQVLAAEVLSPGWLSVRLLGWMCAGAAAVVSALMWLNLRGFGATLEVEAARRMAAGAAGLTLCAALFTGISLIHYSFGRRGGRVGAVMFALTAVASLALPLAARGRGEAPTLEGRSVDLDVGFGRATSSPRVVLILLDGGSLDFISLAVADGRLPSFGKLLDAGAAMHLATLRPTQPGPVWTAVASGKLPSKNGVRSAATYYARGSREPIELLPDLCFAHALVHFGFLTEEPYSSAGVRARPLWSILGSLGRSVGVIGWPLTYPARPVRGYLVSDRFLEMDDSPLAFAEGAAVVYPPDLDVVSRADVGASPGPAPVVVPTLDRGGPADHTAVSGSDDRALEALATALQSRHETQLLAVRYRGLDAAGHYYLRYAVPWTFGDVSDDERRRFGRVLEGAYAAIDAMIGRAMLTLRSDDVLLVVSGFGMEPLSLGKRLLERLAGNRDLSGTHEGAPDGFLLAYGAPVARGKLARGSVVDVTPTVLYFLGVPVGRDMDGYVRTDLFTRAFTAARPITFIPTYDR